VTGAAVKTIDHVAVAAPSELEDAVIEWYSHILGFERLAKPEGTRGAGAWFRAGDVQLHVTIEPASPSDGGHFGVVVDDYDSAMEELRASGSDIESARPIPGRRRCYTHDPAGNTVEIMCYDGIPGA
jgi:catechol 2,3-dioxygenase-like lactoylglutathione lyase family enzyme